MKSMSSKVLALSAGFLSVGCGINSAVDGQAGNVGSSEQAISTKDCRAKALNGTLASGVVCDLAAANVLEDNGVLVSKFEMKNGRTVTCKITEDILPSKKFKQSINTHKGDIGVGYFVARDGSYKMLSPATLANFPRGDGSCRAQADRVRDLSSGNRFVVEHFVAPNSKGKVTNAARFSNGRFIAFTDTNRLTWEGLDGLDIVDVQLNECFSTESTGLKFRKSVAIARTASNTIITLDDGQKVSKQSGTHASIKAFKEKNQVCEPAN